MHGPIGPVRQFYAWRCTGSRTYSFLVSPPHGGDRNRNNRRVVAARRHNRCPDNDKAEKGTKDQDRPGGIGLHRAVVAENIAEQPEPWETGNPLCPVATDSPIVHRRYGVDRFRARRPVCKVPDTKRRSSHRSRFNRTGLMGSNGPFGDGVRQPGYQV